MMMSDYIFSKEQEDLLLEMYRDTDFRTMHMTAVEVENLEGQFNTVVLPPTEVVWQTYTIEEQIIFNRIRDKWIKYKNKK